MSDVHQPSPELKAIRDQIDSVDRELVARFKKRADLIDAAAKVKDAQGIAARLDDRVEQVVANVESIAANEGVDPALMAHIWRQVIEWSIAREEVAMAKDDAGAAKGGVDDSQGY